jgi:hypothetical protein
MWLTYASPQPNLAKYSGGDGLGEWARQRQVDRRTAAAIYQDLLERAAPASAKHETLFSFALSPDAVSKEIRKHGGGMSGAMAMLESEARAGFAPHRRS